MKSYKTVISQEFRNQYRTQWYEFILESKTILGKFKRQVIRPSFPQLENGEINLHLGCGSINHPKFINIDGLPAPHIHYIRAIDNLSPFRDNSVALIYACHCLEHFPHASVPRVLAEWFRVLKLGGTLRISVPDFDLLLDIYKANGNELNMTLVESIMGGQNYKFNFHMAIFNRSSLEGMLRSTGFKEIQLWQPGSSELNTFNDWSNYKVLINGKHYPLSLNIEAVK
jgi:predicted SAM-dependent methyltransferase